MYFKFTSHNLASNLQHFRFKLTEANVITIRKKAVCPRCGMTVEEGGKMYRSLKMPNKYVCRVCAIMEHEELKKKKTEPAKE